jgi:PAS domain S-box-containing protein
MRSMSRSYALAIGALAVAVGSRWVLDPWLGEQLPLVTLFGAVALGAWAGGWGPALLVAVPGYFACRLLFIDPRGTLDLSSGEIIRMSLYMVSCFFIAGFGEAMRRTLSRAREAERRFRLAADAVNGVIYEYDFLTREVVRTRGLFEVLGYRPDEVPPLPDWWESQVHPDDRADRQRQFAVASAAGNRIVMRYRMRHKDGRWLHVEDRAVLVLDAQGGRLKMHGCTVDVTELRQAEDELRRLNKELREADRRKDEFVATLAHELRNPLAPIRNAVQIFKTKEAAAGPELDWGRDVIERQVAHMARLLEDLLDVSRITQRKLELRTMRVSLSSVIDAALEASRPAIEAGGHRLTVSLPAEPVQLEADPVRLAQVFSNLLTNAAKYTERGGRIELSAREGAGQVEVTVKDSGIGIAPEMLGRLFQMFSQAAPALQRAQGGLGIGLSLVKGLVELHGGRVEARSEGAMCGSEFVVHLPLPVAAAPTGDATRGADEAMVRVSHRVLIADDNRDSADTLSMLLQAMGCEVAVAYDGEHALRTAAEFRAEIALLDLGMPRLNGFDTCRRLREEAWGQKMCIVAVTGWGQDEDRRRTQEAGFDAHLVKPVDPAKLTKLLASIPA